MELAPTSRFRRQIAHKSKLRITAYFLCKHLLSIGKFKTPKPCPVWYEAVQPSTLSALEEDLDHLLPLEEEEATTRRGATVSDNYSDSAAHMKPIISNLRGLVRGSDWSGRFEHRKGMKPSKSLKSSPPRCITTPNELSF
jgi:hypothetical protein